MPYSGNKDNRCFLQSGDKTLNFSSTLLAKKEFNETLTTFVFAKPSTFVYKSGQFIMISFDKDFSNMHPFSISSSPNDSFIEITVRKIGDFTKRMHESSVGAVFWIKGPYGMFTLPEKKSEIIMIAGGVGITPFLSMIRHSFLQKSKNKINLIFSARNEGDLFEKETFDYIAEKDNKIKVNYIISENVPEGWAHSTGRVDKAFLMKKVKSFSNKLFYLCGPPPMVESLRTILTSLKVKEENIHVDNWDFAKKIAGITEAEKKA